MMSGAVSRIAEALAIAMLSLHRACNTMRTDNAPSDSELTMLAQGIAISDHLSEQLAIACILQVSEASKLNAKIEADRAKAEVYTPPWKDEQGNSKPLLGGKIGRNNVLPRNTMRMTKPTSSHKHYLTTQDCKELFGVDFTVKELPDTLSCVFCHTPVEIHNSFRGTYLDGFLKINTQPVVTHRVVNGRVITVKQMRSVKQAPILKPGRACLNCKDQLNEILPEADYRKRLPDDPGFADNLSVIKHPLDDSDQIVANGSMGVSRESTFAGSLAVNQDWMTERKYDRPDTGVEFDSAKKGKK